jgi:CheY-like chemotaxis protein
VRNLLEHARTPSVRLRKLEPLQTLKVLLVEDNLVNQMLARRLLEKLGASVTIADTGVSAIEQLRQQSFHLVLMDCQMPEMDGYEATQRIRAGGAGSAMAHVAIIALTANALTGDRERCLAAGMDDYLVKPIDPEALRAKLAAVAALHAHPTEPVAPA